jgi:hypothetical protein
MNDSRAANPAAPRPALKLEQFARLTASHRKDRMQDEMQRQSCRLTSTELESTRERHVVVDDLDDRVARRETRLVRRRIQDPKPGLPRRALARQLQVREGHAMKVLNRPFADVLRVCLAEILGTEGRASRARQTHAAARSGRALPRAVALLPSGLGVIGALSAFIVGLRMPAACSGSGVVRISGERRACRRLSGSVFEPASMPALRRLRDRASAG